MNLSLISVFLLKALLNILEIDNIMRHTMWVKRNLFNKVIKKFNTAKILFQINFIIK
jgi:hypothetical protein